jgi:hypothetical protein
MTYITSAPTNISREKVSDRQQQDGTYYLEAFIAYLGFEMAGSTSRFYDLETDPWCHQIANHSRTTGFLVVQYCLRELASLVAKRSRVYFLESESGYY